MLYHIEGILAELEPCFAVIDCGGIGFGLTITAYTAAALHLGDKVRLYVSESIGENNYDLFGFLDKNERRCFEQLISVSGIGPKAAVSILSHNTPEGLALAIMSGDEKALTVAPGIGKKIAQRVILELKDKFSMDDILSDAGTASDAALPHTGINSDAVEALIALGYSGSSALTAVRKAEAETGAEETEELIKAALKYLF